MAIPVGSYFWLANSFAVFVFYFAVFFLKCAPQFLSELYLIGKLRKLLKGSKMSSVFDVPKRWFVHFYFVGLIANTTVLLFILLGWLPPPVKTLLQFLQMPNVHPEVDLLPVFVVLMMEEIQVIRRLYECLYVHVFSSSSMSIIHYVMGLCFYSLFGLCLLSATDYKQLTLTAANVTAHDMAHFVLGNVLFVTASIVQHRAFLTLADMRKLPSGKIKNTQHHIPKGGPFEYVSSPHFSAEIVIYLGMNIVLGFEHKICSAYLIFVLVNQLILGKITHSWYTETFSQYPKQRKAIIPFLF